MSLPDRPYRRLMRLTCVFDNQRFSVIVASSIFPSWTRSRANQRMLAVSFRLVVEHV